MLRQLRNGFHPHQKRQARRLMDNCWPVSYDEAKIKLEAMSPDAVHEFDGMKTRRWSWAATHTSMEITCSHDEPWEGDEAGVR
jgi:hypothetical protein